MSESALDLPDDIDSAKQAIAAAWAQVLNVGYIDPDVGIFDLGATSATVLVVVELLRDRWPRLKAVDVFLYPTVASLAEFLASGPH